MIRLFVGVGLPEDIRARLAGLQAGVPGARWVPPENIHLSLRFIGDVNEGEADDIHDALESVRTRRFALSLAGVGHFESAGQVHTLWVGVDKNPDLVALRDRVESALVRIGRPPEGRRFTPHVTLARLRDAAIGRVSTFLAVNALFRAGPIAVDRFTLYSSAMQGHGRLYRPEADYALAAVA